MATSITSYTLSSPMADEHRRLACKYAVVDSSTARTLTASDHGKRIWFTNASTVNVTVPSGLPEYFECEMVQKGSGQVVVAAGSGATLNSYSGWLKSAGQWAGMTLANTGGTDTFALMGQLTS